MRGGLNKNNESDPHTRVPKTNEGPCNPFLPHHQSNDPSAPLDTSEAERDKLRDITTLGCSHSFTMISA